MIRNDPNELVYLVDSQAKYYPDFVSVFIPNIPIIKGYSKINTAPSDIENEIQDKQTEGETPFERSIRRTKRRISDYVLCNDFDMFVTFTFSEDRQNVEKSKMKMSNWLRNQRKRNGKFKYLIIPEFHKDGRSLHFHALVGGYTGIIEQAINPKTHQPLKQRGQYVFSISGYTLGFTNVKVIDKDPSERYKVGFYLQKYITKTCPESLLRIAIGLLKDSIYLLSKTILRDFTKLYNLTGKLKLNSVILCVSIKTPTHLQKSSGKTLSKMTPQELEAFKQLIEVLALAVVESDEDV